MMKYLFLALFLVGCTDSKIEVSKKTLSVSMKDGWGGYFAEQMAGNYYGTELHCRKPASAESVDVTVTEYDDGTYDFFWNKMWVELKNVKMVNEEYFTANTNGWLGGSERHANYFGWYSKSKNILFVQASEQFVIPWATCYLYYNLFARKVD